MIEIKAPNKIIHTPKIFLAGSIEMGTAEHWQNKVVEMLRDQDVILLNPRRDDWDSTWLQSIDNPEFRRQVEWELDALEKSDLIMFYFDPKTKSPITLLEIGLHARSNKLVVVCPDGFWRKGNIDVACEKYGFPQFKNLTEAVDYIKIFCKIK